MFVAVLYLAFALVYGVQFSRTVLVGTKPGIVSDLHPLWNGCRAVLHRSNPYREEITAENEIQALGLRANLIHGGLERQFAYPAFAAVSLSPLALLPFSVANGICPFVFAALALMYVRWLRGAWTKETVVYTAFFFASYPVIYCLQSRQPTLLFIGVALFANALIHEEKPIFAGIVAALSMAKPQVSLPILLPLLLFAIQDCRRFLVSFVASLLGLCAIAQALVPGWLFEWIAAVRRYSREVDAPSVISKLCGAGAPWVSGLIVILLIVILWLRRRESLLFQMSLCVVAFRVITPNQFYNSVLLLIPVVWALDHAAELPSLVMVVLRLSLIEYWTAIAVAAILLTFHRGLELAWSLPATMLAPILLSCVAAVVCGFVRSPLDQGRMRSYAAGAT